ncbi:MAG TPA: NAD-dependent epimerase/dehydratase family protein [Tepidisphaeraceae bacterium]|nr:NAD-dependent epimerase/dehydratase family protein [Tepidisphaeraceae bacterium]
MKILVTGATGFLGHTLCGALQKHAEEVVGVSSSNCDLTKPDSLLNFNDQKYDRIYHLAAWTQAGDFCLNHPGEQWIINQQINTTVLNFWARHQPQAKLISIGTSCAYDPTLSMKEDSYLLGAPIESLYSYGMTKRMLYVGQLALAKQYGMHFFTAVPTTLFGPGYHMDGRQMHFIFDLIRKILRGKYYGETVQLWGDGHQLRELIFVSDFTQLMIRLSEKVDNDLVNIGVGRERTIREFAGAICKIVGYPAEEITYDPNQYVGARSKCLRIDKLKTLVPDVQFTQLEVGLRQTVDWFIANRERLLPPAEGRKVA